MAARTHKPWGTVFAARACVWAVFITCCIIPLAWLAIWMIATPAAWSALLPAGFHLKLLARTMLYNGCAAVLATLLGLPAALLMGRGRGLIAAILMLAPPVVLLMPSIVYAYGWMQVLRLAQAQLGWDYPAPGSAPDVLRCIWTLGTWLWPIPAAVMGLSLRRLSSDVQQQAIVDGALRRITARHLLPAAAASLALVALLGAQEFAVYEPTGISVTATEVRMVFETPGLRPDVAAGAPSADQRSAAAAAAVTALPLLLISGALALAARRWVADDSSSLEAHRAHWPAVLDPGWITRLLALVILVITLAAPLGAMLTSLTRPIDPARIWRTFSPPVLGTLGIGLVAAGSAMLIGICGLLRPTPWPMWIGLAAFLVGGQLLAIALIYFYNHPGLWQWVYNTPAIVVMAYLGRFGWLPMWAAARTWDTSWRDLRDMAALDGASPGQSARYIVLPLAWPILAASALLVLLLAMTEVPATVLLMPLRPPMLVPQLMVWVHRIRDDDMLEASLLLAGMVMLLAIALVLLTRYGLKRRDGATERPSTTSALSRVLMIAGSLISVATFFAGCRDPKRPEEIWLETGAAAGQVVYPRGICYSKADDSFYVVDRLARIQHLDSHGRFIAAWRMAEFTQGKPVGLSIGPDGNVWVPDTHYSRVMVFTPAGKLVKQFGSAGQGPGQFTYPSDIAFDDQGRVFVSEFGDHDRIQVFTPEGRYLYEFGRFGDGPGEFSRPQSMVIVGDMLYVTDACNHRISVWRTSGVYLRTIGKIGSGLGEFRFPYGLDIDSKGRLVVCEFGNNRVQLVDPASGKGLAVWGAGGREPGQFAYPWAVAVDQRDRIIAVDSGNNRLQVFRF